MQEQLKDNSQFTIHSSQLNQFTIHNSQFTIGKDREERQSTT